MIDWLDMHAGSVQAVVTVVLVLVTIYYAKQTRGQAKAAEAQVLASRDAVQASREAVEETRNIRREQARAHVTLELWPWDRRYALFDLVIRNYGAGAARDIRVTFNPDFAPPQGGSTSMNDLPFMRNLPFLAPGEGLHYAVGNRAWITAGELPTLWQGTVAYTDDTGVQQDPFRVDPHIFDHIESMLQQGGPRISPPLRPGWWPVEQYPPPMEVRYTP